MATRVYLDKKSFVTIRVKPTMTVRELSNQVALLLRIGKNARFFCIYEGTSEADEVMVDGDTQVLDRLAVWQHRFEYNQRNSIDEGTYRFAFRARLFFDIDKSDRPLLWMLFLQALHDMRIGHYPCTQMDVITLLALGLKVRFGDAEPTEEELECASRGRVRRRLYIQENTPAERRTGRELPFMKTKLREFLQKLRGKSSEWYVCAYMEYVMSWQLYGTVLFPVEVVMSARCDA